MQSLQSARAATLDTIRRELIQTIERLLRSLHRDYDALDDLQNAHDLLDSLLLASDEYATASHRLRNAYRYLVSKESGAARYELRLLARYLRCERESAIRPRRKRQRSII